MDKHAEVSPLKSGVGYQLELSEEAFFAGFIKLWALAFDDERKAQDLADTVCDETTQHCGYSTPHPNPTQLAHEAGRFRR